MKWKAKVQLGRIAIKERQVDVTVEAKNVKEASVRASFARVAKFEKKLGKNDRVLSKYRRVVAIKKL